MSERALIRTFSRLTKNFIKLVIIVISIIYCLITCQCQTRAMASKCVGEEEVGRIFAIFSLISATSSSLVYAAFQSIYRDLANSDRVSY